MGAFSCQTLSDSCYSSILHYWVYNYVLMVWLVACKACYILPPLHFYFAISCSLHWNFEILPPPRNSSIFLTQEKISPVHFYGPQLWLGSSKISTRMYWFIIAPNIKYFCDTFLFQRLWGTCSLLRPAARWSTAPSTPASAPCSASPSSGSSSASSPACSSTRSSGQQYLCPSLLTRARTLVYKA